MKKIKITLIFALAALLNTGAQAQDALSPLGWRLNQYMLHQPFFNPAALGSYESFTAAAFYQNQWAGIDGAPNVQGLDATIPLGEKNFIGANLIRDDIANGFENRYNFNISYAFKLRLSEEDFLSLGLSASGNYIVNDLSGANGVNIGDPLLSSASDSYFAPNMKLGLYYFRENIYAGMAVSNLFATKLIAQDEKGYDTNFLDWKHVEYLMHAGMRFPISEYWDLDASTLMRYSASTVFQADLNALFMYDDVFGLGLSYRTNNEVAILTNFRFLDNFRVGYSYGTFFSELGSQSTGSHEIMLIFELSGPKGSSIVIPRF